MNLRLTKLELYGFKSFARKTEICFDNGITAIIGPNGCGKSNIADAIRWVLGEQSAKQLRGSKMEDVIFNGTAKQKSMGYCEVTLTFDNSSGTLPVEFAEVAVTRRVYRNGDSDYLINKAPCRLKDIQELFRDTGIGKEGYSIIGQGKVEEILSNRSDERRNAFEEAAGVMKYRVRKEEAERKLDNTKKNMQRISDILSELEERIGPLEQQSEKAMAFLKLRDELKDIELNIFLYQHDRITEKLSGAQAALSQLKSDIELAEAKRDGLLSNCIADEDAERKLSASISELQSKLISLTTGVTSHAGEAELITERIHTAQKECERIDAQKAQNELEKAELTKKLAELTDELDKKQAAADAAQKEVDALFNESTGVDDSINEKEETLSALKDSVMEAMNKLSDAKSALSRLVAIRQTVVDRLSAMGADDERLALEETKLQNEYDDANSVIAELKSEHEKTKAESDEAIATQNECVFELRAIDDETRKTEQLLEGKRSRLKVLSEMKRAHEGYYASVRNLLRDCERDASLSRCIEGVVAEIIKVPKDYEAAVEMALGSALQNVVTPTEADAKRVIEYLRSKDYGRATLLPVSAMKPRTLSNDERNLINVDGCFGIASELLEFKPRYKSVVENLLGRTVIVRDLDVGIAINKRSGSAFRIATVKGDIINPGGSMTGGSLQKREFSLLGRERELDDLNSGIEADKNRVTELNEKKQNKNSEMEKAQQRAQRLAQRLHEEDLELLKHSEKLEIINTYLENAKQQKQNFEAERARLRDTISDIDKQCEDAQNAQSALESGNIATEADIKAKQEELYALRARSSELNREYTKRSVAFTSLCKERDALKNDCLRTQKELNGIAAIENSDNLSREGYEREAKSLTSELEALTSRIYDERNVEKSQTDELRHMETERAELIVKLDEMRKRRDSMEYELDDLKERAHRGELNKSRSEMELGSMCDRIMTDYGLTYEKAEPFRHQIAVTASNQRIDELKGAIRELGDVNVSAIDDIKIIKERYDLLKTQYGDLEQAECDLRQLISELVSTMEQEFKAQFELICANFTETFVQLFGGGKAELRLSDPKDILNCDIYIIAQPPGKKLQLMTLLSGGERALTAIALLFAMLRLKPTAFCVLDEIEAALDEVNVSNFAGFLQNYSDDTQFILITHRKGSMEVCNSLYGIAMEEKGISKVVSARLE